MLEHTTATEAEALTGDFIEACVLAWTWTLAIDFWRHDRSRMKIGMKGLILNTGAMDGKAEVIEAEERSPFTSRRVLMFLSSDAPSLDKLKHNAWAMSSITPPLITLLCPVTIMSTKPHRLPLLPQSSSASPQPSCSLSSTPLVAFFD